MSTLHTGSCVSFAVGSVGTSLVGEFLLTFPGSVKQNKELTVKLNNIFTYAHKEIHI